MDPHRPLVNSPVGGDGDGQDLLGHEGGGLGLDVGVVLEDLLHEVHAEFLTAVQTLHVETHFGGGHHFHGLGDLSNAIDGFHAQLDGLLVGGEGVGRNGGQARSEVLERTEHL